MTKRVTALIVACVLSVFSCGGEVERESLAAAPEKAEVGKTEQAFELFDMVQWWLVGKIQAAPGKTLRVCVQGTGINAGNRSTRESMIRTAIMKWVDAIRPTSTVGLINPADVVFTCPGTPVDVAVDWSALPGATHRAYVAGSGVTLFEGDSAAVVLHELGHVFGLSDTYVEGVWSCKPGQPDSVMCSTGFDLQPDDVRGIQEAYAVAFNTQSTLRWFGQLNWCTTSANQLLIGDFNGDGRSDMLCHKNTGEKWVSLADTSGQFGQSSWYGDIHWCGASNNQLFVGKFNADNRDDMLCHNTTTGEKWIRYATAAGGFDGQEWYGGPAMSGWCSAPSNRLYVGKFNADGQTDLLCHDQNAGRIWVAIANSAGQFTGTTFYHDNYWCAGASRQVVVGDFDGNGRDDLVCHDTSSGAKWTLLSDFAGSFTAAQLYSPIGWCTGGAQLLAGDFGGTSASDLLCHSSSGKKWMAFGGSGTFAGTSRQWDMQWCYGTSNRLMVGDFNGDGVTDMLCHDVNSGNKWISYQKR